MGHCADNAPGRVTRIRLASQDLYDGRLQGSVGTCAPDSAQQEDVGCWSAMWQSRTSERVGDRHHGYVDPRAITTGATEGAPEPTEHGGSDCTEEGQEMHQSVVLPGTFDRRTRNAPEGILGDASSRLTHLYRDASAEGELVIGPPASPEVVPLSRQKVGVGILRKPLKHFGQLAFRYGQLISNDAELPHMVFLIPSPKNMVNGMYGETSTRGYEPTDASEDAWDVNLGDVFKNRNGVDTLKRSWLEPGDFMIEEPADKADIWIPLHYSLVVGGTVATTVVRIHHRQFVPKFSENLSHNRFASSDFEQSRSSRNPRDNRLYRPRPLDVLQVAT
jgi:hypothetical protein